MNKFDFFSYALRCPNCQSTKLNLTAPADTIRCESCLTSYPLSHGRPVLLRQDNGVFNIDAYRGAKIFSPQKKGIGRFIPNPSINLSSERVLKLIRQLLSDLPAALVLVVGSGQQRKWLDDRLGAGTSVRVVYSDIDINADVDIFCDGHDLPFANNSFDAVITTAVLEHVLYPERVVAEIHRVLTTGGILYSELPFIQQVHEGAYDFTRYTLSGHRRLLNGFSEINSGMVAGPGTAMVWTIENFVLAFIKMPALRTAAKALVRLLFFWLKYVDMLLENKPEAMDAASCTYFYGSKIEGSISDVDIIRNYTGAKHLNHT